MRKIISKNRLIITGSSLGLITGLLYWNFIGCASGTCMIKSNPYLMAGYGTIMGGLLFSFFKK